MGDGVHGVNGPLIVPERLIVGVDSTLRVASQLGQSTFSTRRQRSLSVKANRGAYRLISIPAR